MDSARSTTPFAQKLYAVLSAVVRFGMKSPLSDFDISGLENLPKHGKVIVACNHPSRLNSFVIWAIMPRNPAVMVVRTMFYIPVLGQAFRMLGNIPVHRDVRIAGKVVHDNAMRRKGASKQAYRGLTQFGMMLMIYPEAKISAKGVIRPFYPGVGVLSYLSGAPVVPIGIRLGRRGLHFTCRINVGCPVRPEGFTSADDITARVRRCISDLSGIPLEEVVRRSDMT